MEGLEERGKWNFRVLFGGKSTSGKLLLLLGKCYIQLPKLAEVEGLVQGQRCNQICRVRCRVRCRVGLWGGCGVAVGWLWGRARQLNQQVSPQPDKVLPDSSAVQAERSAVQAERSAVQAERSAIQAERSAIQLATCQSQGNNISFMQVQNFRAAINLNDVVPTGW